MDMLKEIAIKVQAVLQRPITYSDILLMLLLAAIAKFAGQHTMVLLSSLQDMLKVISLMLQAAWHWQLGFTVTGGNMFLLLILAVTAKSTVADVKRVFRRTRPTHPQRAQLGYEPFAADAGRLTEST